MSGTGELIFAWLQVLDELTYYELFGIASEASIDEVREAFHEFCDTFHPDRHVTRSSEERRAVSTIFKRGTEAYLVLSDGALRRHYDAQLTVRPQGRPQRMGFSPFSRPPSSHPPGEAPLGDAVRSPAARPFARRAEELMRKGDLQQAKLQLVMANHRDPGNEVLAAALRDIEAKLADPKNWRAGRP
ncbi:MAG: DnaJ domain-containing protein [Myxococcota bacterium]|nr:DnaJ domain-containing protein [Myxococcota bacterium]